MVQARSGVSMSAGLPWFHSSDRADLVNDLRPEFLGQVVAHAGVGDEPRAGDARGRVPAALHLDQRVVFAGDDQGGRGYPRQRGYLLRAAGGELALRRGGIAWAAVVRDRGG